MRTFKLKPRPSADDGLPELPDPGPCPSYTPGTPRGEPWADGTTCYGDGSGLCPSCRLRAVYGRQAAFFDATMGGTP